MSLPVLASSPAAGRNGLLLVNLGTPEAPTASAVRRYLRQFLSDPRVIDINPVSRALLVNLVTLPFRPRKSAAAYREIWSATRGSPLLFHSQDLVAEVQQRLGAGWAVELGMRYGQPALGPALARLQQAGAARIFALPLYPQYATSSTGSSLEAIYGAAAKLPVPPAVTALPEFYDAPGFIEAAAAIARPVLAELDADHVLMSYHGLPERQVSATDFSRTRCLATADCCAAITEANRHCYRAQSYATSRALAAALGLPDDGWSVSFQSRLGRTPWIRPFTDEVVPELARKGVKRLAVFCPSFVADCLETLEEIGIRARLDFQEAGGDALSLIPCVNSSPAWADAVADMARRAAQ